MSESETVSRVSSSPPPPPSPSSLPCVCVLRQSFRFGRFAGPIRLPAFAGRLAGAVERALVQGGGPGSFPPSSPSPRDRRGPSRSPSCVRCLRPRCEGRRSGPSRRLTVRLDTSDKGLGTASPFPGVARVPEAQTSRPGGRSVAISGARDCGFRTRLRRSYCGLTRFASRLTSAALLIGGTRVVTL